jgi:hypothetical protein
MSLSRSQVRFIFDSGLFDDAIRHALAALNEMAPLFWALSLARQRQRARAVTRRKQRRSW